MATHEGCMWDNNDVVSLAYADVRGAKFYVASVSEDTDAMEAILNGLNECAACSRHMIHFLGGAARSLALAAAGGNRDAVIEDARGRLDAAEQHLAAVRN